MINLYFSAEWGYLTILLCSIFHYSKLLALNASHPSFSSFRDIFAIYSTLKAHNQFFEKGHEFGFWVRSSLTVVVLLELWLIDVIWEIWLDSFIKCSSYTFSYFCLRPQRHLTHACGRDFPEPYSLLYWLLLSASLVTFLLFSTLTPNSLPTVQSIWFSQNRWKVKNKQSDFFGDNKQKHWKSGNWVFSLCPHCVYER